MNDRTKILGASVFGDAANVVGQAGLPVVCEGYVGTPRCRRNSRSTRRVSCAPSPELADVRRAVRSMATSIGPGFGSRPKARYEGEKAGLSGRRPRTARVLTADLAGRQ